MAQRKNKSQEVKHLHGKGLQEKRVKVMKEIEEKKRAARKT